MTGPVLVLPPFHGFMFCATVVNQQMSRYLRYRTGRTSYTVLAFLIVIWMWTMLRLMPGLRIILAASAVR